MKDLCSSIEDHNPEKEWKRLIVFDDIIANMISEKNFTRWSLSCLLELDNKYFFGFHYTITLLDTKWYKTKHYPLLHHEDSEQTRASTNCY